MTQIHSYDEAYTFLQHLGSTCFYRMQSNAYPQLERSIRGGFDASMALFHNNYKNKNLRSVVFKCTDCGETMVVDYCKTRLETDEEGFAANIRNLLTFFKVPPMKGMSV